MAGSTKQTYLDYAAATPVDQKVLDAMVPYFQDNFYNPSSVYLASREMKQTLADARARIAHWLGARPSEVIFTAGATEANNLALHGTLYGYTEANVVVSAIEHEAILRPAERYQRRIVAVDAHGHVDIDALKQSIDDNTRLVSIMYANNEIGTVQHMDLITGVIEQVRSERMQSGCKTPLYFHTDASQAANALDLHVHKLGVDMMTLNSGKTYGPKQVGALYVKAGIVLEPLILGGGHEKGLRSGTENVAGIVGMAQAFDMAQGMRRDEVRRLEKLTQHMRSSLEGSIEGIEFLGHKKYRLPNIVSCIIPGIDGERLVMTLDESGYQCATGSACSALSDESSHVVKALGRSEREARATLRISLGRYTTAGEVQSFIDLLPQVSDLVKQF